MGRATLHRLDLSALLAEEDTFPVRTGRFGDLYLLEWIDERRDAVVVVVSGRPAR